MSIQGRCRMAGCCVGTMELSYDLRHNAVYLRLRAAAADVETLRVSDEPSIDIALDGTVYGLEFLNASAQLSSDEGQFVLINKQSGKRQEVHRPA